VTEQLVVTVGIVSALWKEAAAMRLLVKGLRRVPMTPNDRNQYQEGWLPSTDPDQPHGVVLALLPQDSTGNASSVCADLFHSYPALECVVMCGIAGGVPDVGDPERHVRLGDIVVAQEIVSYGHIRRIDGEEVLRRPIGGISADLTRAVHELRIGDLAGERPWRAWLDGTDERLARFRRPAPDTDVLYVAGRRIAHPDPVASGHEDGWPKVHYGRIGSADVLLRDEAHRDDLVTRHKLLAMEMEGSGIASAAALRNRPWFMVRGIVDYCENTGKNDAWHLYSSLAAAAYVRALLGACHPFNTVTGARRPMRRSVEAVVRGCGVGASEAEAWLQAWDRLDDALQPKPLGIGQGPAGNERAFRTIDLARRSIPTEFDEAGRAAYCRAVVRRCSPLELANSVPGQTHTRLPTLDEVFVPQHVTAHSLVLDLPKDLRRRLATGDLTPAELPDTVDPNLLVRARANPACDARTPVLDVVTDPAQRLLVLLGEPGTGKSSLLRYLALQMAGSATAALTRLDGWLPLLVELRRYADPAWRTGSWIEGTLLDYMHHLLIRDGLDLSREAVHHFLRDDGDAVVMFDGLDEIFDVDRRDETARHIATFADRYPRVRVIVTSRISSYNRSVLGSGFALYALQDLNSVQISQFVEGWSRHTNPSDSAEAQRQVARILTIVDGSAPSRDLAGNPMLLTILAMDSTYREAFKERYRIYRHAVTVLTCGWDVSRSIRDPGMPMDYIDEDDKLALLRRIAARMQEGRDGIAGNRIAHRDLLTEFQAYLCKTYSMPATDAKAKATAKVMLAQLRDRNFILTPVGPDLFGFVHRALLEYCCADDIVQRVTADELTAAEEIGVVFRTRAPDPSWQEVLLLVASMLDDRLFVHALETLLDLVRTPPPRLNPMIAIQSTVLALRAIAESRRRPLDELAREAMENLIEQLAGIRETIAGSLVGEAPPPITKLAESVAALRVAGVDFAHRDAYLAWYRDAPFPETVFASEAETSLAQTMVGIAVALFPGSPDLRRLLQDQAKGKARSARRAALHALATEWPDVDTRALLADRAATDDFWRVRLTAVTALATGWPDADTRTALVDSATSDEHGNVRAAAVEALAHGWPDRDTRSRLVDRIGAEEDPEVRLTVLRAIAMTWPDSETRTLVTGYATGGDKHLRLAAVPALAAAWPDRTTRDQLAKLAVDDDEWEVRESVITAMATVWPDEQTRDLLADRVRTDSHWRVKLIAVNALADGWRDEHTYDLLVTVATFSANFAVQFAAVRALATGWADERARVLTERAAIDGVQTVRWEAVELLPSRWPDERTRVLLMDRVIAEPDEHVRDAAMYALVSRWADERMRLWLTDLAAADDHRNGTQRRAWNALAIGWPGEPASR
jgi:nucleoside phosphorylase